MIAISAIGVENGYYAKVTDLGRESGGDLGSGNGKEVERSSGIETN